MHEPWEWDESDLQRMIDEHQTEGVTLDFKSSRGLQDKTDKKIEIQKESSKDVSAFANSAGGTLIYGTREDRSQSVPFAIDWDDGCDPLVFTPEWLDQIIHSSIQRRPLGVRIKPVQLSGLRQGKVAYVVHAPQSRHAPHMAWDNKYYKRFEFRSVPMEDWEVRDVMGRASRPILRLDLSEHVESKSETLIEARVNFNVFNPFTVTAGFVVV